MKGIKLLGTIGLISAVALNLGACGKSNNTQSLNTDVKNFKSAVPTKTAKKGGVVKVAIETDTPFSGIFNYELSTNTIDSEVMQYGAETLFKTDNHYLYNNKGAATIKINPKAKTATVNIKKDVKWSDGKPVTAKDYEYAYEIIANKNSGSKRYSSSLTDLIGLEDYHDGKTKTIKGFQMPDGPNGRKAILHFKTMKPGMMQAGNGYIWENAVPYHYLKDVPFDKLISSDKIRKHPIFFGPYKLSKIVPGQSLTWVPNEYYYQGQPKLDKITASVISPNSVTQAIRSNKFDVISVLNSQWGGAKQTKNVNFIKSIPLGYSYLAFKVGKWNAKKGENVMDPDSKMSNKALRQAIAYGMNVSAVDKRYTQGLSFKVPTLIPAQFGDYFDKSIKGYTYNIKKGNELLDKAGYKKKGTYRVQPNGKPLTINLAAMSGNSLQEAIIKNYIQQWKKEGLKVQLTGNRLIELNSFYDKIQNDDPSVDMFMGVWNLAHEPSPNHLYGEKSPLNYSRFVTKKNNQLLEEMNSQKAFNHKYRIDKFHEWQKYMDDEAYVVPISNSYRITAVNKNITGYSLQPSDSSGNSFPNWYKVAYVK